MGNEGVPQRDAPTPVAEPTTEEEEATTEETAETETEEATPKKDWKENFNVKDMTVIDTVDRLQIVAGVNEYKGNFLVFLAKVTDKNFSRQFFSMPAWVWQKTLEVVKKHASSIAEVEKKAMVQKVVEEIKRLRELGIDVSEALKGT